MFNFYERVRSRPEIYNQLTCKELLFVHYNCPLDHRKHDVWSQHYYIQYIIYGKMAIHTAGRSWLLKTGDAYFVKKGASIIEKFFEEPVCIITFFIPDSYLKSFMPNLLKRPKQISKSLNNDLIYCLHQNDIIKGYIESVVPYFYSEEKPSEELLELKFRELLLNILSDPHNEELNAYLQELISAQHDSFSEVMEANCTYNLTLSDYARLVNLSLSSFKRHFFAVYKTTPGQWLQNKRLDHAYKLLITSDRPISDISFESGFESSTHFSQIFKKRFGASPLKFRKQIFNSSVSEN